MENKIEECLNALPQALIPTTVLPSPNSSIELFNGAFQISFGDNPIDFFGEITFSWKPNPHIYFKAETSVDIFSRSNAPEKLLIKDMQIEHGTIQLTAQRNNMVRGKITGPFRIVHQNKHVDRITFEIPNLRNYNGLPIKNGRNFSRSRLQWKDEAFTFTIDQLGNFSSTLEKLKEEGGFGLTHTGEIQATSGVIDPNEISDITDRLRLFISFLNGKKTFPTFLHCYAGAECVWEDYSPADSDGYLEIDTWLPFVKDPKLDDLWQGFNVAIKNEDDYQCVDYMLHWLFEANKNSALVEGSIVLLQNAFELLFNWKLKKKQDGKLSADEKIRRLLQHAAIDVGFHPDYDEMLSELKSTGLYFDDFPRLFTLIRNAIVHSDQNKRTQLAKFSGINRFYIKHIALHHMELLLLHLFGYKGMYCNRLPMVRYTGTNEEQVPWNPL
ncbi:hypothetical protein [Pedobacter psychrodurus]|uniref:hypothetical protein n=1 Tax=Pedobacter psychrodurus TaxID=2530456 RepID=UPI00293115CE|nr:hypothetical protein [Pedobacter psychrodurus]